MGDILGAECSIKPSQGSKMQKPHRIGATDAMWGQCYPQHLLKGTSQTEKVDQLKSPTQLGHYNQEETKNCNLYSSQQPKTVGTAHLKTDMEFRM